MPKTEQLVFCLHCQEHITRKRETQHRQLRTTPHATTAARSSRSSRAAALGFRKNREIFSVPADNEQDDQDDAMGASGTAGVLDDGFMTTESTGPFLDDQHVEDDMLDDSTEGEVDLQGVLHGRWRGNVVCEEFEDDEDLNVNDEDDTPGDIPGPIPQEDPNEADTENLPFDWDSIEYSGLSAWDQLGESFERKVAAIGVSFKYCSLYLSDVFATEDKLLTYDRAICRAFAYKVKSHTTDTDFAMIPFAFPSDPPLPPLDGIRSRVSFLAGFKPEIYDCCVDSCCCFTGPYADLDKCPYCNEARYHAGANKTPRKRFTYIPLTPRLVAFAANRPIATRMQYRSNYAGKPGVTADVFDSDHYQTLRTRQVTVNGKSLPHKYFEDHRDVALGLSTDGFGPFKHRKHTAWPLIVFDYNLGPEERFLLENILALGVVPGPKKPKDMDSFLWPFVQEMLRLAHGVRAFDILTSRLFSLRAFLILVFGDIPAVSLLMRMKGHNAISPCRMCNIIGVRPPNPRSPVHYVPLDRSSHPNITGTAVRVYDADNLPLHSHEELLEQAREVHSARTNAESDRLAKQYGIKGVPILSCLDSLTFPASFPYGFMHLIWENLTKNLILLWTGQFKDLDEGTEEYEFSKTVFEAIGRATAEAGSTIPSMYGSRVPNIEKDKSNVSAEMWSFWTMYLGPVLLRLRFRKRKYFTHFISLVKLLNICLQFEITDAEIRTLRDGFSQWVKKYEEQVFLCLR